MGDRKLKAEDVVVLKRRAERIKQYVGRLDAALDGGAPEREVALCFEGLKKQAELGQFEADFSQTE